MHGDPNFLAGGLAGRERNCRRGNVRFNLVELGIGAFDFGAAIVRPCLEGVTYCSGFACRNGHQIARLGRHSALFFFGVVCRVFGQTVRLVHGGRIRNDGWFLGPKNVRILAKGFTIVTRASAVPNKTAFEDIVRVNQEI